ncbi:MAG TPA: hypothetical protein VGG71_06260, partial [Chitinophagaceae bacterium]
ILSPNAPNQDYHEMIKSTIHEFAHCVSRDINWTIVNDPRWLWEAIAIYDVGYFLVQYLVETKGSPVLNALIKNNGNIMQTLDMDDEEFTKQWFAFVKKRYSI